MQQDRQTLGLERKRVLIGQTGCRNQGRTDADPYGRNEEVARARPTSGEHSCETSGGTGLEELTRMVRNLQIAQAQRSDEGQPRCRVATRVRIEGRDHGGLGLRSRGEGFGHGTEASLKKKKNEQEEDGGKMLNKIY